MKSERVSHRLFVLGLSVLAGLVPAVAWACSCVGPMPLGLLGTDGQLPANARGLLWDHLPRSEYNQKTLSAVKLTGPGGKTLRVESQKITLAGRAMALLRPAGGFKPGQTYQFQGVSALAQDQRLKVSVSPTSLQPHKGSLELELGQPRAQKVTMLTRSGSCSTQLPATVIPIAIQLPAAAKAFQNQLYYQTLIDGKTPWQPQTSLCSQSVPGVSWIGERGSDQLYTSCDPQAEEGLKPGRHTVEMQATLPGTNIIFRSERVSFEARCPS